ncbi:NYN domain-containing protein [Myceligenerans sp. TRM 65318]|uniref:NYN domain-containing protein n=2 Tax=Myceligenerans pegani TaxID=2776917 RepID=A0ABR9N3X5_9MICO|nr:NYN domain-containing protein [Myceligenerans sp. TRM 65318]MBE3020644.1 NYN domain-containing protein [Myceligenerans sp. TRM 65318]
MNVIGSRPDGWWRDRTGAMRRLAAQVDRWAPHVDDDVVLVLDGDPRDLGVVDHVRVVWAPGARNAADHRIVDLVSETDDPTTVRVITSDRELADRVRALGASVTGSGSFRTDLSEGDSSGA